MIHLYFHPTPDPAKIALFLEEVDLPYEAMPVDTSKGEQHAPLFRPINSYGKVPAKVDTDGPVEKQARVFDSTAILLNLAEKTGKLLGPPQHRPELLSWLPFIASGPAVARARSVDQDHPFKKVNDEHTKRALFPSNYPLAA